MITFKQFFKESVDRIHREDCKREVHVFYFHHSYNIGFSVSKIKQVCFDEWELSHEWDNPHKLWCRETRDPKEFLSDVERYIRISVERFPEYNVQRHIDKVYQQAKQLSEIVGTYKLIYPAFQLIYMGVEVDKYSLKGIKQAQEDDLLGF